MKCRVSALVLLALVLSLCLVRPVHAAKLLAITFDDGPSPVYIPQVLDELDKRIGALEQGQLQHTQALARDLRRFDEIDEVSRLTLDGVRNLLDAQLSGNNREGMQKSRTDIDNYLLKGVTNHGSTGN